MKICLALNKITFIIKEKIAHVKKYSLLKRIWRYGVTLGTADHNVIEILQRISVENTSNCHQLILLRTQHRNKCTH